MKTISCEEVGEQLDLFAAGECPAPTRAAIARHLEQCGRCATSAIEARRLIGLLDLHANFPNGLRRLQARLREEERPRRALRHFQPFVRGAVSLAALLLLTFGLGLALPWGQPQGPAPLTGVELALTLRPAEEEGPKKPDALPAHPERAKAMIGHEKFVAEIATSRNLKPIRRGPDKGNGLRAISPTALEAARRAGKVPAAPKVELAVRLRNDGPGALYVELGGKGFAWWVRVRGPGAISVPGADERPFAKARQVAVPAGADLTLRFDRLVSRVQGQTWYTYWTAPGEHRVSATVRVRASREPSMRRAEWLTRSSATVRVRVAEAP